MSALIINTFVFAGWWIYYGAFSNIFSLTSLISLCSLKSSASVYRNSLLKKLIIKKRFNSKIFSTLPNKKKMNKQIQKADNGKMNLQSCKKINSNPSISKFSYQHPIFSLGPDEANANFRIIFSNCTLKDIRKVSCFENLWTVYVIFQACLWEKYD